MLRTPMKIVSLRFIGVPDPKQPVAQSQIQRLSSQAMSDKRLMLLSVLPRYDAEKFRVPDIQTRLCPQKTKQAQEGH